MKIVTLYRPVDLRPRGTLQAGVYYMENVSAVEYLYAADGDGLVSEPTWMQPLVENEDYNGRKILIMRIGGFGDLLFLTPSLKEIKRRWPRCHLAVCCGRVFAPVFDNIGLVDEIVPYPPTEIRARTFHAVCPLEGIIEGNPLAETLHATDVMAKYIGLSELHDKLAIYDVSDEERAWAKATYPKTPGVRRLGIQVRASAASRTYPLPAMNQVGHLVHRAGWETYILGKKGDLEKPHKELRFHNCCVDDLTFRQSAAVLTTCDVIVGPDSALVHVAGAQGIPCVALYGPFPWKLRTAYARTTVALQGIGACAPCFHHERKGQMFPVDGPCHKSRQCDVLSSITPEKIAKTILRLRQ